MELNTLTKKELIEEVKRLKSENTRLENYNTEMWDNIKILITKIAHEMKTPLNSIIGFGELFLANTNDEKLKNYTKNILKSSHFMLSLIQNTIDITRLKNKSFKLSLSIFNSRDTIQDIINEFNNDNINFTLIDKTICADYTRFKQVIYNLISNAVKYNRSDKNIEIITYLEEDFFCFEITDYGEGIAKEKQDKIFELFTQVSKDDTKKNMGLGLGLALCKSIAIAHNGDIMVTSEFGEGSTFIFKIPLSKNLI